MKPSIITLPLIILLVSCSGGEARETTDQHKEANTIQEPNQSNGVADTSGADIDSTYTMKFERGITYGSSDKVVVGKVATFAVDNQNRVFIADMDQTTIHVFDSEGRYLTSLGRKGEGPGEFGGIHSTTTMIVHLNQLYVTDIVGNNFFPRRLQIFSLEDLSFSHTMKLLAENREEYEQLKGYYPKQIYPRRDGAFLVAYHRSANEYKDAESYIRYVVQDSLANIISGPIFEQRDLTYLVYKVKDARIPFSAVLSFPFYKKSLLAISDNDHLYAVNNTEEFKVDVYDTNGKQMRTFQHPFNNRTLIRSELIDQHQGVALKMIREAENLPETWPALETMFFDDADRLWVSTITEDDEIYEWWVLNEQGTLLTRFTWPRSRDLQQVKNGFAYTLESDESTGLQKVVQYRIEMKK